MTFLDEIAAYAEAQGLGVVGTDIFKHSMPVEAANAILFRTPINGMNIDQELPGYRKGSIQMIVRDKDYLTGQTRAWNAMIAMTIINNTTLGAFSLRRMYPRHEPISYPRGASGLLEFSVNFDVTYADYNSIV